MGSRSNSERADRDDMTEKYARAWFASMAKFHDIRDPLTWEFTEAHVIAFLRSKLKQDMPAWKRLKIVEGVMWYRDHVKKSATPRLETVRAKLREIAGKEKNGVLEHQ